MGADGALRLHAPAVQRRIGFQKAQIRPVQQEAARSFQRRANTPMLTTQDEASRQLYALTQHFRLNLKKLSFGKRQIKTVRENPVLMPLGNSHV